MELQFVVSNQSIMINNLRMERNRNEQIRNAPTYDKNEHRVKRLIDNGATVNIPDKLVLIAFIYAC